MAKVLLLIVVVLLWNTNPKASVHYESLRSTLREVANDAVPLFGGLFVGAISDDLMEQYVSYHDWLLFSYTTIKIDENNHPMTTLGLANLIVFSVKAEDVKRILTGEQSTPSKTEPFDKTKITQALTGKTSKRWILKQLTVNDVEQNINDNWWAKGNVTLSNGGKGYFSFPNEDIFNQHLIEKFTWSVGESSTINIESVAGNLKVELKSLTTKHCTIECTARWHGEKYSCTIVAVKDETFEP